jgi:small conductance mechanosensitive channel
MDVNAIVTNATTVLIAVAWKVAGAFVLWLIGRWLIGFAVRLLARGLGNQQFDPTLSRYFQTGLAVVLNVALVVAILGYFGVETTTFAALIAAGGVAIGVAWGGLLANFAAGAFLVFLRPFKVGDAVAAGGVTGTVDSIGLFGTTINTPDNVRTIIGNSVDHNSAIRILKERLARIPNVLAAPAPDVDVLQFTPAGPLLCVRPYCANQDYWQVYFDANRVIRESFGEAGFPAPVPSFVVAGVAGPAVPAEAMARGASA